MVASGIEKKWNTKSKFRYRSRNDSWGWHAGRIGTRFQLPLQVLQQRIALEPEVVRAVPVKKDPMAVEYISSGGAR